MSQKEDQEALKLGKLIISIIKRVLDIPNQSDAFLIQPVTIRDKGQVDLIVSSRDTTGLFKIIRAASRVHSERN